MTSLSIERNVPHFRLRAVNLGGWLVTEGWIKPSLFDAIPNKHLLDGTTLRLKSVTTGKYLSAESGGGNIVVANGTATDWDTFTLWRIDENSFRLKVFKKQFVGLDGITIVAVSHIPTESEKFHIIKESDTSTRVRIKASRGYFLQAKSEELVLADVSNVNGWGNDDSTVFEMEIIETIQGEFQLTNGYGPTKAPQIMKEHWSTFIVEDDFKFMASSGLHAARIPIGWWIASDPTPPSPYVGGSLQALDNAFLWGEKYGLRIIIDLHAAPGSQNGFPSSSSRDGSLEWGKTDENIEQTVQVIDFLTARYAKSPSLYAVELINEPLFPSVSLENLIKYYKGGYNAVRKHSSTCYVVLSNRIVLTNQMDLSDPKELFPLANGLTRSVIDVHYYSLYYDVFNNMTVQQNIDFINTVRSSQLNHVTTTNDGPLIFVGEWSAEWKVDGATKEDYQKFAKAQLDVFGHATFGWAYWTLKNVENHWSLEWMINNGYIKLI